MGSGPWYAAIDLAKAIFSVLISSDHQMQFALTWQNSSTPSLSYPWLFILIYCPATSINLPITMCWEHVCGLRYWCYFTVRKWWTGFLSVCIRQRCARRRKRLSFMKTLCCYLKKFLDSTARLMLSYYLQVKDIVALCTPSTKSLVGLFYIIGNI